MGKGSGGGSNTTTVQQQSQPNPVFEQAYQNLLSAGQNQAQQPLHQYTGPMVAGFDPQQLQAMQEVGNLQGVETPYINAAQQEFGAATQPLWGSLPQFDTSGMPQGAINAIQAGQQYAQGAAQPIAQDVSPYAGIATGAAQNLVNNAYPYAALATQPINTSLYTGIGVGNALNVPGQAGQFAGEANQSAAGITAGSPYAQAAGQAGQGLGSLVSPYTGFAQGQAQQLPGQVSPYSGMATAAGQGIESGAQPGIDVALNQTGLNVNPYTRGANQAAASAPGSINQFLSPYTQNVTSALQNLFNQQNAQGQAQVEGNAVTSGAYGGDRQAVAQALTAQQQQLAEAPALAQTQQQGFMSALQAAQQQASLEAQTGISAGQLQTQAAQTRGQLGLGAAGAETQAGAAAGQLGLGAGQLTEQTGIGAGQLGLGAGQLTGQMGVAGGQLGLGAAQTLGQLGSEQAQAQLGAGQLETQAGLGAGQLGVSAGQLGLAGQQVQGQLGLGAGQLMTQAGTSQGQLGLGAGQLMAGALGTQGQLGLGAGQLSESAGQNLFNEFNQQQQTQLSAEQANAWLASQAGFGEAALGQQAQSAGLAGAQALYGMGTQGQQLAQEQLNVPYEQFLQQQAYPYQQLNFLSGLVEGTGGLAGGTSSTSYPGPSALSQVGGLGLAGAGLVGATGGFGSSGWLGDLFGSSMNQDFSGGLTGAGEIVKRGGRVGLAGGGIPGVPDFNTPGNAPINIDTGVPDVSVSYVPGSGGAGVKPPMISSLMNQSSTSQSSGPSAGGGASGIAGDIGAAAGLAKLGLMIFAKDGGRTALQSGGVGADQATNPWGFHLPAVPKLGLDYIVPAGPAVKGEGPPKPPPIDQSQLQASNPSLTQEMQNAAQLAKAGKSLTQGMHGDDGSGVPGDASGGPSNTAAIGGKIDLGGGMGQHLGLGHMGGMPTTSLSHMGIGAPHGLGRPRLQTGGEDEPLTSAAPLSGANPNVQNQYQNLQAMPMEKLQELSLRIPPGTTQGQLIQRALMAKRMTPGTGTGAATTSTQPMAQTSYLPMQSPATTSNPSMGISVGGEVPDYVTEDEIDPHPMVDHTGQTVVVHYPSEGKSLDLGLPSMRKSLKSGGIARERLAGGGPSSELASAMAEFGGGLSMPPSSPQAVLQNALVGPPAPTPAFTAPTFGNPYANIAGPSPLNVGLATHGTLGSTTLPSTPLTNSFVGTQGSATDFSNPLAQLGSPTAPSTTPSSLTGMTPIAPASSATGGGDSGGGDRGGAGGETINPTPGSTPGATPSSTPSGEPPSATPTGGTAPPGGSPGGGGGVGGTGGGDTSGTAGGGGDSGGGVGGAGTGDGGGAGAAPGDTGGAAPGAGEPGGTAPSGDSGVGVGAGGSGGPAGAPEAGTSVGPGGDSLSIDSGGGPDNGGAGTPGDSGAAAPGDSGGTPGDSGTGDSGGGGGGDSGGGGGGGDGGGGGGDGGGGDKRGGRVPLRAGGIARPNRELPSAVTNYLNRQHKGGNIRAFVKPARRGFDEGGGLGDSGSADLPPLTDDDLARMRAAGLSDSATQAVKDSQDSQGTARIPPPPPRPMSSGLGSPGAGGVADDMATHPVHRGLPSGTDTAALVDARPSSLPSDLDPNQFITPAGVSHETPTGTDQKPTPATDTPLRDNTVLSADRPFVAPTKTSAGPSPDQPNTGTAGDVSGGPGLGVAQPTGLGAATPPTGGGLGTNAQIQQRIDKILANIQSQGQGASEAYSSPWMPLMAAGFGMAASPSHFPLQAIGQGGLQGIKAFEQQQKELPEIALKRAQAQAATLNAQLQPLRMQLAAEPDQPNTVATGAQPSSAVAPIGGPVSSKATTSPAMGKVIDYTPSTEFQQATGLNPNQYNTFRGYLAGRESGSYDEAPNPGGYMGRYQMGGDNSKDKEIAETAKRLGVPVPSQAEFLKNPQLQEQFFENYTLDHHNQLMSNPAYANASPEERAAILAGAHLGGVGGVQKYLATNGGYNPGDAPGPGGPHTGGTHISSYVGGMRQAMAGPADTSQPPTQLAQAGPNQVVGARQPGAQLAQSNPVPGVPGFGTPGNEMYDKTYQNIRDQMAAAQQSISRLQRERILATDPAKVDEQITARQQHMVTLNEQMIHAVSGDPRFAAPLEAAKEAARQSQTPHILAGPGSALVMPDGRILAQSPQPVDRVETSGPNAGQTVRTWAYPVLAGTQFPGGAPTGATPGTTSAQPIPTGAAAQPGGVGPGAPGQGIPIKLAPQQEERLTGTAREEVKAAAKTRDDAQAAQQQQVPLNQMKMDAPHLYTGPFEPFAATVARYLRPLDPARFDEYTASHEDFVKNQGVLVRTATHDLSPRAAYQEVQFIQSQLPNPEQSPKGLDRVLSEFQGLNDYKIAKGKAQYNWEMDHGGPGNTQGFEQQWAGAAPVTPYTFVIARMPADERANLFSSMAKTNEGRSYLQQMQKQRQYAVDNGLL